MEKGIEGGESQKDITSPSAFLVGDKSTCRILLVGGGKIRLESEGRR